jgi:tyrosyl-tRNA synthetase
MIVDPLILGQRGSTTRPTGQSMSDLYKEFDWRGQVSAATEGTAELLARGKVVAYSGFDPTAASLHVGNLVPIMALKRVQRFGHTPIALIGGGTGLIGDPSGKSLERVLLSNESVQVNVAGIRTQLSNLLQAGAGEPAAKFVDNADWLTSMTAMEFLRDVGKYFTVNYLLAKESVKRRLESEDGISYTEFSYSLLQAYDFLVLHDRFGCTMQVGGSDQWGNIVAGCDLVRKLRGKSAHGLVMPLLTTAAGAKFGKTEAGTVWLDPGLTSPFRFYQFWLNADDRDVIAYLKCFTFRSQAEIAMLEEAVRDRPEQREAQRQLARDVTEMVHGPDQVTRAERASEVLFTTGITALPAADLISIFADVPSSDVPPEKFAAEGASLVELLSTTQVTASKGEATRLIRSGGIYVNNRRITDEKERLTAAEAIDGQLFLIRKGQRQNFLVRIARRP